MPSDFDLDRGTILPKHFHESVWSRVKSLIDTQSGEGTITTISLGDGSVTNLKLAPDVKVGSIALLDTAATDIVTAINQLEASMVTTFISLTDTPTSYSGQGSKSIRVNSGATALEFYTPVTGATTWLGLSDTPDSYAGESGKAIRVNDTASALEFFTPLIWGDSPIDGKSVRISASKPVVGSMYDGGNGRIGIGGVESSTAKLKITTTSEDGISISADTVGAGITVNNTNANGVAGDFLVSGSQPATLSENSGAGTAAYAHNSGTGRAHFIEITLSSNTAVASHVKHAGIGKVLHIEQSNTSSTNTTEVVLIEAKARGRAVLIKLSDSNNANAGIRLEHGGTGNCLELWDTAGGTASTTANNIIVAYSGTTGGVPTGRTARLTNAGSWHASAYNAGGVDFAEKMDVEGSVSDYADGDVLTYSAGIDRTIAKTTAPNQIIIGVYSSAPGFISAPASATESELANMVNVAFTGIVLVNANDENGAISRGDLLVSSSVPGEAMKAGVSPAIGTVIGVALQALAAGTGSILSKVHVM